MQRNANAVTVVAVFLLMNASRVDELFLKRFTIMNLFGNLVEDMASFTEE